MIDADGENGDFALSILFVGSVNPSDDHRSPEHGSAISSQNFGWFGWFQQYRAH
jgi:hypothetical protein